MRELDDVIVSCAMRGAVHVPSMSPHLPVHPDEIVTEAVAAAEAGASIGHVGDPETGEPTSDLGPFRDAAERIGERCDAIVQPTTGGSPEMSVEERVAVVSALQPAMTSRNTGSINSGLYPILDADDEFEYEWERPYLGGTRDTVFPSTFADLETVLPLFDDHGTVPELGCSDIGHLYDATHFVDRSLLESPLHVRVGREDDRYLREGKLAESNADLVEKAVDLAGELTGREPASPDQVRDFLGLEGPEATAFA